MSRRYGRNQRRKARELIESLTKTEKRLKSQVEYERNRVPELIEFERRVINIVGHLSILDNPNSIIHRSVNADFVLPIHEQSRAFISSEDLAQTYKVRTETLRLMSVDSILDKMRGMLHTQVMLNNQSVRYAISDHALHYMPTDELAKRLAAEMAPQLAQAIHKEKNT